jgi:hypothetical protein
VVLPGCDCDPWWRLRFRHNVVTSAQNLLWWPFTVSSFALQTGFQTGSWYYLGSRWDPMPLATAIGTLPRPSSSSFGLRCASLTYSCPFIVTAAPTLLARSGAPWAGLPGFNRQWSSLAQIEPQLSCRCASAYPVVACCLQGSFSTFFWSLVDAQRMLRTNLLYHPSHH